MEIGERIKMLRLNRGYTQIELGKLAHCSGAMIAQIERGTKAVTVGLGKEIAEALDVDLEELYK